MSTGAFGDDTASALVRSMTCAGNELELLNCTYNTTTDPKMCTEHSAAVICQGELCIQVCQCYQCYITAVSIVWAIIVMPSLVQHAASTLCYFCQIFTCAGSYPCVFFCSREML